MSVHLQLAQDMLRRTQNIPPASVDCIELAISAIEMAASTQARTSCGITSLSSTTSRAAPGKWSKNDERR